MKNYALRLVLQTLALVLGASLRSQAQSANTAPADTIVFHGHVYTENENTSGRRPWPFAERRSPQSEAMQKSSAPAAFCRSSSS